MNILLVKEGGLFDFDLTLIAILLEIVILTFLLNLIFYNPVLSIIEQRRSYINDRTVQLETVINKTNELTIKYEEIIRKQRIIIRNFCLNFEKMVLNQFDKHIQEAILKNVELDKKSKSEIFYQTILMAEVTKQSLEEFEQLILAKFQVL